MKLYDKINYNNYEWKVIKIEDDNVILAMASKLNEEDIIKYFTNKEMIDSYYDVKYSFDISNNNWSDSYIRFVLNSTFLEQFDKKELNIMDTNGVKDYIRLLTKEEVEKLSTEERNFDTEYGFWTMSPYYFSASASLASVWYVSSVGHISNDLVTDAFAVVPVISLKRSSLNAIENENGSSFSEEKIELLHYHNADNELEYNGKMYTMRVIDKALVEKIDEIVSEINKLKKDEKE